MSYPSAVVDAIRDLYTSSRQLKQANEKLKPIRQKRQDSAKVVQEYFETSGIQSRSIEINGESVQLAMKRETAPLTLTYIETCLEELMEDEEQIEYIMTHIRENRASKSSLELREPRAKPE